MLPVAPDRTVVINLERQPDRLTRFREDWEASGWTDLLGVPQVVAGVDDSGHRGCWASHVAVLQRALEDGLDSILVFEDDAIPQPESLDWLTVVLGELPLEADGLWLDATNLGPDNWTGNGSRGTRRLRRPPLRTHGYLVRRPLLEQLVPLASAYPAHIDRIFHYAPLTGQVYAAVPSLVEQAGVAPQVLQEWRAAYLNDPQRSNVSRWLRLLASIT